MELIVADTYNGAIKSYDGAVVETVVSRGILFPTAVTVDEDHKVYACDAVLNEMGLCREDTFTPLVSGLHSSYRVLDRGMFRPHAVAVFEKQMSIADPQGIKLSEGNFVETMTGFPEVCGPQGICISA